MSVGYPGCKSRKKDELTDWSTASIAVAVVVPPTVPVEVIRVADGVAIIAGIVIRHGQTAQVVVGGAWMVGR